MRWARRNDEAGRERIAHCVGWWRLKGEERAEQVNARKQIIIIRKEGGVVARRCVLGERTKGEASGTCSRPLGFFSIIITRPRASGRPRSPS